MALENEVVIYTDGACEPNPGTGGWAAIVLREKDSQIITKELTGREQASTNNRMEITAVLKSLQLITQPCAITVYSDSQYVVNSIGTWVGGKSQTGWMNGWWKRNWTKKDGPLKNIDLWQEILKEVQRHLEVRMKWVRGHDGHVYNDRCDLLAVEARKGIANAL